MKTFETEKGNIPEGATHYANETDTDCFIWYREDTKEVMVDGYVISEWEGAGKDENLTDLTPIPQTKEVGWEVFHGESWYPCIRFSKDIYGNYAYQISDGEFKGEFNGATEESCFRKPETEAERIERERIESARVLYSKYCKAVRHPAKGLDNNAELLNAWLVIVDETGYRKEK